MRLIKAYTARVQRIRSGEVKIAKVLPAREKKDARALARILPTYPEKFYCFLSINISDARYISII